MNHSFFLPLFAILMFAVPLAAAPVAVGNFSFENDEAAGGPGTSEYPNNGAPNANATSSGGYYEVYTYKPTNNTTILGPEWSVTSNDSIGWNLIEVDSTQTGSSYNNRFGSAGTSDGSKYAFINLYNSSITSTSAGLNLTIQPLTTYTLTIAVGNPTSTGNFGNPAPNEFIGFLANGSALNSTLFPLATVNVSSAPNGTFTDYSATFTTGVSGDVIGEALAITMYGTSASASYIGAFDNVRLDATAVPEPSTYALLVLGLGGLMFLVRLRVQAD